MLFIGRIKKVGKNEVDVSSFTDGQLHLVIRGDGVYNDMFRDESLISELKKDYDGILKVVKKVKEDIVLDDYDCCYESFKGDVFKYDIVINNREVKYRIRKLDDNKNSTMYSSLLVDINEIKELLEVAEQMIIKAKEDIAYYNGREN